MASGTERLPLIGEAVEERSDETDEVRPCRRNLTARKKEKHRDSNGVAVF